MLTEGDVLNHRYQILRVLSDQGGMGVIYQATDLSFDNTVVIKHSRFTEQFIKQQYPTLPPDQMRQYAELLRKAFAREARLLRGLNYPALPQVIDYFTVGDEQQFFVMDFIPGQDFDELLKERNRLQAGPFAWAEVRDWADQLLAALDYLHTHFAEPIIHRDIKPANLKLKPDGKIVLLDFGLAKGATPGMSVVGSVLPGAGTVQYAPPEQMQREGTDARSDMYSLAVTLHHLLTGEEPPKADFRSFEINCQRPDPLHPAHELNPQIPAAVSEALQHAAALNPDSRPATAVEMREALRRASQPEPVPNPSQPSGNPSEPTTIDPPPTPKPTPTLQSLIDAINEENVGVVRDLLDRGVAVNALDDYGSSPLVTAVNKCSFTMVKMLLAKGADLEAKTSSGATALIAIMSRENCSNLDRIAQALLDTGANVNARNNKGETALMLCMGTYKSSAVVKALIAKGSDLEAKDYNGQTALMAAVATFGKSEIVSILLNAGAEVDAIDGENRTLLIKAVQSGIGLETVKALLNRGLNVDAKDKQGKTALMWAANYQWTFDLTIVRALLENRADINARDSEGRTPLMLAAAASPEIVQVLLEKKADLNAMDNKGWTALMLAEEVPNNEKIIEMLKKAGAK